MESNQESNQGAEGGASSTQSNHQQPQDQRLAGRRSRTLRNLVLLSLIVCIALIGVSSLLVTGTAGALRGSWGGLPGIGAQRNTQQNIGNVGPNQPGPDIIPSCDCQSAQVSLVNTNITGQGHEIVVNLAKQQLYAYLDGQLQFTYLVTTGRPELPTPIGRWSVLFKATDITFYSPWPVGSSFYYYPTHINYALNFHDGGFYLHDAWWRHSFGPGSNVYHQNPDGSWETGSHGCIGMTLSNAAKLYAWAPVGTSVLVIPS
jgi:lipoprotein-anchoring transpeptidase ErfK/SrfK